MNNLIDTDFDMRTDAAGGDPDSKSLTLRKYHRLLWSKPLPNGKALILDMNLRQGEYSFSSDSIIHTFSRWKRYQHIISQIPQDVIEEFRHIGYSIGGSIIFPNNKVDGKHTINQTRGCEPLINDRFDLTLECIRRYYNKQDSPLFQCLDRYPWFFEMFIDFKGYVDFFLLQDLVSEDYSNVNFFIPFNDFNIDNLPKSVEEYLQYKENNITFIKCRNARIKKWAEQNL